VKPESFAEKVRKQNLEGQNLKVVTEMARKKYLGKDGKLMPSLKLAEEMQNPMNFSELKDAFGLHKQIDHKAAKFYLEKEVRKKEVLTKVRAEGDKLLEAQSRTLSRGLSK
jgi:hypothetical protein